MSTIWLAFSHFTGMLIQQVFVEVKMAELLAHFKGCPWPYGTVTAITVNKIAAASTTVPYSIF